MIDLIEMEKVENEILLILSEFKEIGKRALQTNQDTFMVVAKMNNALAYIQNILAHEIEENKIIELEIPDRILDAVHPKEIIKGWSTAEFQDKMNIEKYAKKILECLDGLDDWAKEKGHEQIYVFMDAFRLDLQLLLKHLNVVVHVCG